MTFLDDLFNWAGSQPPGNVTHVLLSMATNQATGTSNNLVSYAVGTLTYNPPQTSTGPSGLKKLLPASFTSLSPLTQYFSDRVYPSTTSGGPSLGGAPFNAGETDPLNVTITAPQIGRYATAYGVTVQSPKWGFSNSATLNVDPTTNIIYFMIGATFYTISLCNQNSFSG